MDLVKIIKIITCFLLISGTSTNGTLIDTKPICDDNDNAGYFKTISKLPSFNMILRPIPDFFDKESMQSFNSLTDEVLIKQIRFILLNNLGFPTDIEITINTTTLQSLMSNEHALTVNVKKEASFVGDCSRKDLLEYVDLDKIIADMLANGEFTPMLVSAFRSSKNKKIQKINDVTIYQDIRQGLGIREPDVQYRSINGTIAYRKEYSVVSKPPLLANVLVAISLIVIGGVGTVCVMMAKPAPKLFTKMSSLDNSSLDNLQRRSISGSDEISSGTLKYSSVRSNRNGRDRNSLRRIKQHDSGANYRRKVQRERTLSMRSHSPVGSFRKGQSPSLKSSRQFSGHARNKLSVRFQNPRGVRVRSDGLSVRSLSPIGSSTVPAHYREEKMSQSSWNLVENAQIRKNSKNARFEENNFTENLRNRKNLKNTRFNKNQLGKTFDSGIFSAKPFTEKIKLHYDIEKACSDDYSISNSTATPQRSNKPVASQRSSRPITSQKFNRSITSQRSGAQFDLPITRHCQIDESTTVPSLTREDYKLNDSSKKRKSDRVFDNLNNLEEHLSLGDLFLDGKEYGDNDFWFFDIASKIHPKNLEPFPKTRSWLFRMFQARRNEERRTLSRGRSNLKKRTDVPV